MAGMSLQGTGSAVGSACCCITRTVLRCAPTLRFDQSQDEGVSCTVLDQEGPAADFGAVRKHMAGMRLQDTGSGVGSALCYITFLVLRCAPALRMDHDES